MKFQKELDDYAGFLIKAQEQMQILKDRSDEQGAIEIYQMWLEKRKDLLRNIAEDFRKTGVRAVATEDILMLGELDHSWFVLPEPKAHRVVK
jgi:hypothetical protein